MAVAFLASCEKENPYQEVIEVPKKDDGKEEKAKPKVEIILSGQASFSNVEFTDSIGVKRTVSPNVFSTAQFSAVCVVRNMQSDTVIYQPVLFEKVNDKYVLKEHKLLLNNSKTTENKMWKAKFIAGGEWNEELKKWTLSPKFFVHNGNATDAVSLDLPLSTDWIDISVSNVGKTPSEGNSNNTSIQFKPQGVVLAQRLYTNNVSQTVNVSQLKFQTSVLSFGSYCNFANKSILDASSQSELTFENSSNTANSDEAELFQEYSINLDSPISLLPKSADSKDQYIYMV